MLTRIRARRENRERARRLHACIIEQSREPHFYAALGVPDTMLGRYEMVCLHAWLLLTRLKREGEEGARLAQVLHNVIFDDFDIALREVGIGDMGIGKRIKKLARNLHGRISVYDAGLAAGDRELAAALRRNMYASAEPDDDEVAGMIAYIRAARREIDGCPAELIFDARPRFPEPDRFAAARQPESAA
ncbi:MAG: ubiquinol-cytochrome C chaperone family protein [Alphaproteobacteria bacterium]|nr:ubiquinol-cytochrome C chaperone family protein [Alphaproteobacteria bacterium]